MSSLSIFSNQAIQAWKMSQEEAGHRVRHFTFNSGGNDESMTTRVPAESFNFDHFLTVHRLKKHGKVRKLAGWVLHKLSDNNKAKNFIWKNLQ